MATLSLIPSMITIREILWCLLGALLMILIGEESFGADIKPKRAVAIEEKYHVRFLDVFHTDNLDGWVFSGLVPLKHFGTIAFLAPVNATNHEMEICIQAAAYCAGWCEALEAKEQKEAIIYR